MPNINDTAERKWLESIVKAIKEFKEESHGGAKVMGINLEGPFIAMSKKGAQNAEYVRGGTIEEFDDLYAKSGKLVKLITIAPEAFDSEKFIKHCKRLRKRFNRSFSSKCERM